MMNTIRGFTIERFVALRDPEYVTKYLKSAFEEDMTVGRAERLTKSKFGYALGEILRASLKSVSSVSKETGISSASLYRISNGEQGDSGIRNIAKILDAVGLEITFKSKKK